MRNQQILLGEVPKSKLGAEHFKLAESEVPKPAEGEVLVRVRLISLDAANRAWMQGATYRSAVTAGNVMAGGAVAEVVEIARAELCAWRSRLWRYWLAGICRGSDESAYEAAEDRADDEPHQRLRHCRAHRLFRAARRRQTEGRRDGGRVGGCGLGRVDRRPNRQDQGLPGHRYRRRRGEMRLARARSSASTRRWITKAARSSRR